MDVTRWREEFPVTRRLAYFNHAAVAPLATRTRRAMEGLLADVHENGTLHWQEWLANDHGARQVLARLIGAEAGEIALLKNTSEGLAMVAQGLDWRPGDRVVTAGCEFPANLYPWLALREHGVAVELVRDQDGAIDMDDLRRRCRGARLLALSYVQYLSGARLDVAAVGAICRETGTIFVLDAIQGLGAFPVDVQAAGVHVLTADGHKWLTGPEGCAVFYVHPDVRPRITPREIGWMSVEDWADFGAARRRAGEPPAPLPWRRDGSRYECGTQNTVGIYGLRAAAELVLEAGIENIAARVLMLTDRLVEGLQGLGAEIHGPRGTGAPGGLGSGIVSFRLPGRDSSELLQRLAAAGICCSQRQGWVRCAPHFYNDEQEVGRLLAALPRPD